MADKYKRTNLDPDILAILKEGPVTITFVTTTAHALNGLPYSILTWEPQKMMVGISEEFFNEGLDEMIAEKVAMSVEALADSFSEEEINSLIKESATTYLGDSLKGIVDNLLLTQNPSDSNFNDTLERLLQED
tara:strand:- start:16787 stop:17185 length:399 start_codon:yes stop_codon:yes gene_type:complete